jgi:hypothetical protein
MDDHITISTKWNFSIPQTIWKWNVFGGEPSIMLVSITFEVPLWRRILTRIFLGSKWERIS